VQRPRKLRNVIHIDGLAGDVTRGAIVRDGAADAAADRPGMRSRRVRNVGDGAGQSAVLQQRLVH
jgi:hypothetical protein